MKMFAHAAGAPAAAGRSPAAANLLDASTMEDVGRNQPRQFVTGEFRPQTPHIPGAVMSGIGGHEDDSPWLWAGSWQTCEYWTPMVGYTMWLMAELQKGK
jgi:hypothetical protein